MASPTSASRPTMSRRRSSSTRMSSASRCSRVAQRQQHAQPPVLTIPVGPDDHVRGPAEAPVTLVMYGALHEDLDDSVETMLASIDRAAAGTQCASPKLAAEHGRRTPRGPD